MIPSNNFSILKNLAFLKATLIYPDANWGYKQVLYSFQSHGKLLNETIINLYFSIIVLLNDLFHGLLDSLENQ